MLWLDKHKPSLKVIPPEIQARLDAGNDFGDLAMGMFGPYEEMTVYRPGTTIPDKKAMLANTPAFALSAKHIIHTVGPAWVDGKHHEREILRSCYANSLALAAELDAQSIAFPLIATGVYGFPKDEALNIAMAEIGGFLLTHDMKVILVVFDRKAFELSGQLVGQIDEYIDEHGVGLAR